MLPNLSFRYTPKTCLKHKLIWKEKAGVVSENPVWCSYIQGYLYMADTFLQLLKQILTEWKHNKHLIG